MIVTNAVSAAKAMLSDRPPNIDLAVNLILKIQFSKNISVSQKYIIQKVVHRSQMDKKDKVLYLFCTEQHIMYTKL